MRGFGHAVPGLAAVPLSELVQQGVQGIIFDLDNTLMPARSEEVPGETQRFLAEVDRLGLSAVILSNGRRQRAEKLARLVGLPVISSAKKPFGGGYRKALGLLGLPPEKVVAVGDQFLTDSIGAWRQRIRVVLVDPLTPHEALLVRACRPVDRILRRLLVPRVEPGPTCLESRPTGWH